VFNNGELYRDFTYIDDIVNGVISTITIPSEKQYSIYNIGNSKPVKLTDFIEEIEICTNKTAIKEMQPMQAGDVEQTWADVSLLQKDFGYTSKTEIKEGINKFINWYVSYYQPQ
jgi:UDP-glucuronate 4-epimerase